MNVPPQPGIDSSVVSSDRLTTRVLFSGPSDGEPVLFLHGNLSTATWWETTMLRLPDRFRAIAPDQRGYGGADYAAKIEATKGLGDLADDAFSLLDHLGVSRVHVVGNSLGSNVVWQMMVDDPARLVSVTQVAPGSPYGFGGTKGEAGEPCFSDYAGSGGGLINPQLTERLQSKDAGLESLFSPRSALRALLVAPGFIPGDEDALVSAMLATHVGDEDYPGDMVPSVNWPFVGPGIHGPNNALSPKYTGDLVERLVAAQPKPPLVWIRGDLDKVVADAAMSDPGTLGQLGLIPGWPGADTYPAQPMVAQTRAVLDRYQAAGGDYREHVIEGAAHLPFIELPEDFDSVFHAHIKANGGNKL